MSPSPTSQKNLWRELPFRVTTRKDASHNSRSSSVRCVAVSSAALFASDLPEATGQQGDDFLLNLRIVQKAQKRLFEGLVLLGLLDLVFSFGSILHRMMIP